MKRLQFPRLLWTILPVLFFLWMTFSASLPTVVLARQSTTTPSAPASSTGMYITVITEEPQINVRMGPSASIYPIVGTLLRGATAPALGKSAGGDWVQIEFPGAPYNKGWVYSPLVSVSPPGTLFVVESPPTPVPPATPTIDPTLAAQFNVLPTSTRLPTFTPPPSMTFPIYTQTPATREGESIPLGVVIVAFVILGVIGFLLSVILRR
ncbi:MAG: hypothetical protein HYZ23_07370 [Chloroflexi bacterium]|nr:hypothetical protein [Chloroflexota bacterium]